MAGPSVMVKILGDVAGLGQSVDTVGTKGTSAASRMQGAFSGVLGQLNQTGVLGEFGGALESASSSLEKVAGHGKEIGPAMMGAGGAVAGLGLALQAAGSKDQAAHQQLQAAVEATGASYDKYGEDVEAAIKHQERFGTTANETQDALRVLTQATGDPKKALEMLGTATDLAAAKHESLSTAAESLGKVYNGQTRVLKEFGVEVVNTASAHKSLESATKGAEAADKTAATANQKLADVHAELAGKTTLTAAEQIHLRDATANATDASSKATAAHAKLTAAQVANKAATGANGKEIDELGKKLSGQASAQADTFSGHLKGIKAAMEDHIATIGQKYGPALTGVGAAMTGVGATIEVTKAATQALKDQTILSEAATKIATATQWLFNAAMDANPILLVVLALVAIVAAIILAYDKVSWFRDLVNSAGQAMVGAFNTVKGYALDAFNWLKENWPLVLGILTGPFGLALVELQKHWSTIKSWLTGLPGDISTAVAGMWDGIASAFKSALNHVIDLWNSLQFTLPKVDIGPVHLGGETVGVPHVPHLAQGGLITQSGLIFAHAGEAISPIPAGAGLGGPAVHIDNVNVSSEMDVDLFMRRAAWAARTSGL